MTVEITYNLNTSTRGLRRQDKGYVGQKMKMVRQRRQGQADARQHKGTNSSSSNGSNSVINKATKTTSLLSYWKQIIGCLVLGIAVCFGYMGYLETRVNTPFDDKKMVIKSSLDVPKQFWGSYRPGVYFGMKTRDPASLVTGLMWYFPKKLRPGGDGIRHWCEQGDNLEKYGWLQHDGSSFGLQQIIDGPYELNTSFVKRLGGSHGGDWTARITVDVKDSLKSTHAPGEEVSIIWYTALDSEEVKGEISPTNSATKLTGIKGVTPGLGEFTMKLTNYSGTVLHESFLSTVAPGLHLLRETVLSSLRLAEDKPSSPRRIVLAGELLHMDGLSDNAKPNFVAVQLTGKVPFTVDVVFESGSFGTRQDTLVGEVYTKALKWHQARFVQRFEDTFGLKRRGYTSKEIYFAQAALSNMIGGIGYFFGTSRVQSFYTKEPVHYWKAPLYTAVPSRSHFPRGFLWDEGFHGLLISTWDVDMELDIISHWFDLMNVEGWIPREQVLGAEALARIPEQFVVQQNTNANPPAFLLTLQYILRKYYDQLTEGRLATLERLYPRLQAWFAWFNTTQKGPNSGTYRWRGRDALTNRQLNPETLTSGLDDYPRASHPTENEYHIDLYCWIATASDILAKLANLLDKDGYKYEQTAEYLKDNDLMDNLHWSSFVSRYSDYGYHTDSVKLKRPQPQPRSQNQNMEMVRVTLKNPEYRFVDSSFGYVSIFPFLLQMVEPDSIKLEQILDDIGNPELLWTQYGLRSLSKNSPLYMKYNTEHNHPYWRGQIWININYLAVKALHYYGTTDGPYREKALKLYGELRENVIKNVMAQYFKTGYLWEQYNDKTGEGSGCRPFTGWTALVVLMMSEQY